MKYKHVFTCFPGGKHKALTMSYDDGKLEDERLVALFNKYGIKGTFNINSGIYEDERRLPMETYRELYKGHEVACHTACHPTISRCPLEQVVEEVMDDRKELEKLMGYPVRGLAYPNGSHTKEIRELLPSLGIKYGRIVGDTHDFGIPEDFYAWQATCHHSHNLLEDGQRFVDLHKTQYLYLMYVWGHSYEFRTEEDWKLIEDFCKLAGGQEDIWYATNIEIVDYLEDAKRLQFSADCSMVYNPNARSIYLQVGNDFVEVKGGTTAHLPV